MDDKVYSLENIFEKITKKLKLPEFVLFDLKKVWGEVTGDIISQISEPASIENDILTVYVLDPVWMNQLNIQKEEIINKWNNLFGKEMIKEIKYKIGFLKSKNDKEKKDIFKKIEEIKLRDEDLAFIEKSATVIKDDELRDRFKNLSINYLKIQYLFEKKAVK